MKLQHEKSRLACKESIAHLWGYPEAKFGKRPTTATLFTAIAGEALACLYRADWEDRIRRIENILSVVKFRIRTHREEQHQSELDSLVRQAKEVGGGRIKLNREGGKTHESHI